MRAFSTVELLRDLKTVTHAATRAPITITQHRKPRFVMMAIEDYEKLRNPHPDPRRAYRIEETPPELAKLISEGLRKIIDGDQDGE